MTFAVFISEAILIYKLLAILEGLDISIQKESLVLYDRIGCKTP